jgi:hypothetical protein
MYIYDSGQPFLFFPEGIQLFTVLHRNALLTKDVVEQYHANSLSIRQDGVKAGHSLRFGTS